MTLTFSWLQIFKPTGIYPHHGWDPSIDLEALKYWPLRRKSPRRVAKIREIFHAAVYKKQNRLESKSSSFVESHLRCNIKLDQEAPYMEGWEGFISCIAVRRSNSRRQWRISTSVSPHVLIEDHWSVSEDTVARVCSNSQRQEDTCVSEQDLYLQVAAS